MPVTDDDIDDVDDDDTELQTDLLPSAVSRKATCISAIQCDVTCAARHNCTGPNLSVTTTWFFSS